MALLSGRPWGTLGWLGLGLALVLPARASQASATPSEWAVKAAFLYHFAKFVEWPSSAFATPDAPFAICVLGEDPFGELIDEVVRGNHVGPRRVVVRRHASLSAIVGCQILYLARDQRSSSVLAETLAREPALTVADHLPEDSGVVIRLMLEAGKVRFDVDEVAARRVGLRISSKLLRLANRVRRDGGD